MCHVLSLGYENEAIDAPPKMKDIKKIVNGLDYNHLDPEVESGVLHGISAKSPDSTEDPIISAEHDHDQSVSPDSGSYQRLTLPFKNDDQSVAVGSESNEFRTTISDQFDDQSVAASSGSNEFGTIPTQFYDKSSAAGSDTNEFLTTTPQQFDDQSVAAGSDSYQDEQRRFIGRQEIAKKGGKHSRSELLING